MHFMLCVANVYTIPDAQTGTQANTKNWIKSNIKYVIRQARACIDKIMIKNNKITKWAPGVPCVCVRV